MARLSKDNTAYERDENGDLPQKEVPLETLDDKTKENLGFDEDEEVTVLITPPTRGKLTRKSREAAMQDGDDEDEVTEFDMDLIRDHVDEPNYGEDDYIQSIELVRALIAAIYAEATGMDQNDVLGESVEDMMEEAENENFQGS